MNAREVAAALAEIALLSELNDPKPFRARAYLAAARAVEIGSHDLAELAAENRLTEIPGIGAGIAETIRELVQTGISTVHEELRIATPAGLYDLLKVPGLGPRRVRTVHEVLGVDSLDELERAVLDGRIATLAGFGAKTADKLVSGIAFVREGAGRLRYADALQISERLLENFRSTESVLRAEPAGGVRRLLEVVHEIEIVLATERPDEVVDSISFLRGLESDSQTAGITLHGTLVDGSKARIHLVQPAEFSSVWLWETGSRTHVAALASRAAERRVEFGRGSGPAGAADEAAIYAALGLAWIPPELREGMGEIEDIERDGVPPLIRLEDLRGTFHCHTTFSDGKSTLEEMAEAARSLGWRYLGLADHSQAAAYAGGLSPKRVLEQHAVIDAWNRGEEARAAAAMPSSEADSAVGVGTGDWSPLRLFKGIESDILADGRLDYGSELLASFDYVVGSVHSGFKTSEAEMTERIIRAVRNPYLTILGHPTGRRLLTRGGYPLDVRAVLEAAVEEGVIVEINAHPHRLDLDWRHLRYAVELGVLIAINPDAHSLKGLNDVIYGINMARKGALEPRHVLNTWPLEEVEDHFARRKARVAQSA